LEGVVNAIAERIGYPIEQVNGASAFVAHLAQIEATLPVKSIVLEPLFQPNGSDFLLRFRLSNTGNRDVELIEIEVCVPKFIIIKDYRPQQIPNVFSLLWQTTKGREELVVWEQPYDGALDSRMYGHLRTLPRVVSPHWTPRLCDCLKIPIRGNVEAPEQWAVDYKVIARGLFSEPGRKFLSEIPTLE
jgi:hypothetical protein